MPIRMCMSPVVRCAGVTAGRATGSDAAPGYVIVKALSTEMIVRLLVLPLLAGAAAVGAAPPVPDPSAVPSARSIAEDVGSGCRTFRHAGPSGASAESRKLGELPAGDLVLTVYRTENGCPEPLIVRKGIGGPGEAAAAPEAAEPAGRGPRIVPRRW